MVIAKKRHPLEYKLAKNTETNKVYRVHPDKILEEPYQEVDYYEDRGKKFPAYDCNGRLIGNLNMLKRLN